MQQLKRRNQAQAIDASELDALLDDYLTGSDFAAKTRINYGLALLPFRVFWASYAPTHDYKLSRASFADFDRWYQREYVNGAGRHPSAFMLARTGRVLQQFMTWLHQEGCTDLDLGGWIIRHRNEPTAQYWPTMQDLQQLFDRMPSTIDRLRNVAMLAIALSTGARRMEIASLCAEQVHFDSPITQIDLGGAHGGWCELTVTKGGKRRIVAFDGVAGLLLKCHLRTTGTIKGRIFRMTDNGVALAVARICKAADLPEMSAHALRRAFAEHFANAHSGDIVAMQLLKLQMGHSLANDVTTSHYVNLRNERAVLDKLRQYHTSPLVAITFDWQSYPVHIPTKEIER